MQKLVPTLGACLLLLAFAVEANAQIEAGRFRLSAGVGAQDFAESSALKTAFVGALDANYFFTRNIAVGLFGQVSRPETDPSFYPLVRLDFGEETELHQPAQRVTSYVVGLQGELGLEFSRFAPYAVGGVGYYAFTLDPEQNRSDENRDGYSLNIGIGATYAITSSAGILLDIRDVVLFEYDRDWFNLSDPLLAEPRVPEPGGEPPEKQSTIHNLRFSIGFTYVPGAGS
jgi:outer membrane protein W